MPLFDLSRYDLKIELEKPNDKEIYFFGDKVKGKIKLTIKRDLYTNKLTLKLVKESKIKIKSKLDNKETIDTKTEFLYNDILDGPSKYCPEKPNKIIKEWSFQILIPKPSNYSDNTLMKRFFDAFYPAEITDKYYLQLEFDLPWPYDLEIIKKELKVKEK
jgi:hypothetical protein